MGMMRPPLPAPPVQAQMGTPPPPPPPGGGMGALASHPAQPGAAGGTNPHGAILSQGEAVKTVLAQMARTEPVFAPFADQASQAITNGIAAVTSSPNATPEGGAPGLPSGPPPPPGSGAGMPPMG